MLFDFRNGPLRHKFDSIKYVVMSLICHMSHICLIRDSTTSPQQRSLLKPRGDATMMDVEALKTRGVLASNQLSRTSCHEPAVSVVPAKRELSFLEPPCVACHCGPLALPLSIYRYIERERDSFFLHVDRCVHRSSSIWSIFFFPCNLIDASMHR